MASRTDRFRAIAEQAREKTNQALSEEIATLTPLTADQIERLLPTKADKERFATLMTIVSSSTATNEKVADLKDNIDGLGSIVIRILRTVL